MVSMGTDLELEFVSGKGPVISQQPRLWAQETHSANVPHGHHPMGDRGRKALQASVLGCELGMLEKGQRLLLLLNVLVHKAACS